MASWQAKVITVQALCPGFTHTEFHDSPRAVLAYERVPLPKFLWLSADYVVEELLKSLNRNKSVCIPSFAYRVIVIFGKEQSNSLHW